jgi:hypothetical protein
MKVNIPMDTKCLACGENYGSHYADDPIAWCHWPCENGVFVPSLVQYFRDERGTLCPQCGQFH